MIDYDRLRAPSEHLGVLVEPDGETLRRMLAGDGGGFDAAALRERTILDQSILSLRDSLRARLALCGPLVVTGHQTEFFHAGVLVKSIAAAHLAEQIGQRGCVTGATGHAAFISVDSDTPKGRDVLVPQNTPGGLRRVAVPFTDGPLDLACEALPRSPRDHWLDFFTRVATMLDHYPESLLRSFSDAWLARAEPIDFGDATAAGRAAVERALDLVPTRELRISRLCTTPEFLAFVSHIVLDAEQFARDYNAAQADYRERFGVRSEQRPAPPLALLGDGIESPFWLLEADGRRRRMFVSPRGREIEIRAGAEPIASLDAAKLRTVDGAAHHWPERLGEWRVRPRALTLSCFARMLLADLFIHGIGGARYDAMTDDFARRFFGTAPPPIACVTATLRLPLPRTGVTREALGQARLASRDVRYNPQRRLPNLPGELVRSRRELAQRSDELRRDFPGDHAARRAVFEAIRTTNERLLAADPWGAAKLDQRVEQLEQEWRVEQIALDREYYYGLHRTRDMRALADKLREILQTKHGAAAVE
jgi:hypothetical protein